jgi:hypothetical protein
LFEEVDDGYDAPQRKKCFSRFFGWIMSEEEDDEEIQR